MIKKFLIGLFSLFFIMPAMAATLVRPTTEAVGFVVNAKVDADKRDTVVEAIVEKLDENKEGISVQDMMDVCSVAGWNTSTSEGKDTCKSFVVNLVEKSAVDFKHVCNTGGGTCYEDFSKVQVNSRDAVALAKKLIAKKNPSADQDKYVVCAWEKKNWNRRNNDDFIPCVSLENDEYYEVRFDDATESFDKTRRDGVANAVCKTFHNVGYTAETCMQTSQVSGSRTICDPATCNTSDATVCNNINKDLSEFGATASFVDSVNGKACRISFNAITKAKDLKHPYGLDSFAFCKNIQIMGNSSLDNLIETYVRSQVKDVKSFSCQQGDIKYTGGGCSSYFGDKSDDVVKCFVNGQEVDFVFDDLAETWKKYSKGGYQAISCEALGGIFDGKHCQAADEKQCEMVRQESKSTCPDCKDVYWDKDNKLCILPNSKNATNWQKGIKIGTDAAIVVGAAATTIFSGGAATPAWVVVTTGVMVGGGAAAVLVAEVKSTYLVYTKSFASDVNSCLISDDVECAKELLNTHLQKMVSREKDLTDAEKNALDETFAKLFEKIPYDDDEFWGWLDNKDVWECNNNEICKVKEKKQWEQHLRTWGNISMIAGSIFKAFADVAYSMTRTTNVIQGAGQTRNVRIVQNMNNKVPMVKNISAGGSNSILTENAFIRGITINGKTFQSNSELAAYLLSQGYKVGDVVTLTSGAGSSIVTTTILDATRLSFNPYALAAAGAGTYGLLNEGEAIPFMIKRPTGDEETIVGPQDNLTPVPSPIPNPGSTPSPTPVFEPQPITTSEPPASVPDVLPTPTSVSVPVPANNTPTTTLDNKKKGLSGLEVAAIGAGVAGLGVGAALLLAGDKESESSGAIVSNNVSLFNGIKMRADGIIGAVNGESVELVPVDSINGINENIVSINGHAVVLVKYNNNKIPFMVDVGENGSAKWTPFTHVNMNTGVFTKYDAKVDIMRTTQIAEILSDLLPPLQMQYFASPNADGVQFVVPSAKGYGQINDNDLRHLTLNMYKNTRSGVFFEA